MKDLPTPAGLVFTGPPPAAAMERTISTCSDNDGDIETIRQRIINFLHKEIKTNHKLQEALFGSHRCSNNNDGDDDGMTQLELEWISGGSTNYCFKVVAVGQQHNTSHALFVKYSPGYARCYDENTKLPKDRVQYEYHGMNHMGPDHAPRALVVEPKLGLLVSEYLDGYKPLANYLINGDMGGSHVPQVVGKVMGKLHGGSWGKPHLLSRYPNSGHITFWDKIFFGPLYDVLDDPYGQCTKSHLAPLLEDLSSLQETDATPSLSTIISMVQAIYALNKEALVHADLHAFNVLIRGSDLKIIDAEKFYAGPAGLDVGLWMANYMVSCKHSPSASTFCTSSTKI